MGEQERIREVLRLAELDDAQRKAVGLPPKAKVDWVGRKDGGKRGELAAGLLVEMETRLAARYKDCRWKETAGLLPMSSFEGAGRAAKKAADDLFKAWTDNAALTPNQLALRRRPAFVGSGADANLLEVSDFSDRARARIPITAYEQARYTASLCADLMQKHHFTPYGGVDEEAAQFLDAEVLRPFTKTHESTLIACERYGFAITEPRNGLIFLSGSLEGWKPSDGEHNPLVAARKWKAFTKLLHEYVHTLQHPNLVHVGNQSQTVREGFCEYLTQAVIASLKALPAHDAYLQELDDLVTGGFGLSAVPQAITGYTTPSDYVTYVADTRTFVREFHENALYAAFFQGHTEFLGFRLETVAEPALPARGDVRPVHVPHTVTTLADLAGYLQIPAEALVADNPGLSGDRAAWPSQIHAPGFRPHFVVINRPDDEDEVAVETPALAAAQNGVTPDVLQAHNPPYDPARPPSWFFVPTT
ncbi:hypothetical protein [Actinocorallia sp. API 0066]|uniref:hypothetical protein n=1 Tax=Actinocorallia sp. API 0066 TaxID=2896846 RepID=UPI0027148BEF|nr:hypothetical protein [Actinocorallia sp. API 0066]